MEFCRKIRAIIEDVKVDDIMIYHFVHSANLCSVVYPWTISVNVESQGLDKPVSIPLAYLGT